MNPSISRGTIAQALTFAMWASDLTGHPAVGAILHDPNLATDLTTFLALAGTLWGVAEHIYAAYTSQQARAALKLPLNPPATLTMEKMR